MDNFTEASWTDEKVANLVQDHKFAFEEVEAKMLHRIKDLEKQLQDAHKRNWALQKTIVFMQEALAEKREIS